MRPVALRTSRSTHVERQRIGDSIGRDDADRRTHSSSSRSTGQANSRRASERPAPSLDRPDPTVQRGAHSWVWKSGGRPIAVMGIELYAAWSLEFVSLSTGLVEAQDGQLRWRPQKAGVEYKELPGAPAPANDQPKRLRQMRDLVKRISAESFTTVNTTRSACFLTRSTATPIRPPAWSMERSSFMPTVPTPRPCF